MRVVRTSSSFDIRVCMLNEGRPKRDIEMSALGMRCNYIDVKAIIRDLAHNVDHVVEITGASG